ncbi:acyl carrier protein [Kitasatospora sp. NPDC092948]|uniref:acyl carrier protein n=1 Tax=Kitasatospora sp. NPDC092948 TaxID=3364088 RepID=UPI0038087A40
MNTQDKLTELLGTHLGIAADQVTEDTSFQDLKLDSLALIELTMVINKAFGIDLDDWALTADTTIEKAVAMIEQSGDQL